MQALRLLCCCRCLEWTMKQKDATSIEMDEFKMRRSQRNARIKDDAEAFTKTVSLIGITHATDRKRSRGRRYVWTIWLLVGVGLALYQIQDRTVYYLSYPYNTEFNVQNDKQLLFPQVTICKENWASKAKARELGNSEILLYMYCLATGRSTSAQSKHLYFDNFSVRISVGNKTCCDFEPSFSTSVKS